MGRERVCDRPPHESGRRSGGRGSQGTHPSALTHQSHLHHVYGRKWLLLVIRPGPRNQYQKTVPGIQTLWSRELSYMHPCSLLLRYNLDFLDEEPHKVFLLFEGPFLKDSIELVRDADDLVVSENRTEAAQLRGRSGEGFTPCSFSILAIVLRATR